VTSWRFYVVTRVLCRYASFVAVLVVLVPLRAAADINIDEEHLGYLGQFQVHISGTITKADAQTLQTRMSKYLRDQTNLLRIPASAIRQDLTGMYVSLNSDGGDIFAAMDIGRVVRSYPSGGGVHVELGDHCLSSCALIFIAGARRYNNGLVGVHRPYLGAAPQDEATLKQQVPLMLATVKRYVAEMGITDGFYEVMVNTLPAQMKLFSGSAIEALVPVDDPIQDEIDIAISAQHYGLNTAEMRRREADVVARCPDRNAFVSNCAEAIRWGVSRRDYDERFGGAVRACPITAPTFPTTCIRNFLLGK